MALDEQVIGSLDSHQADPSLASGAAAVMPFNPQISEQVLGQFASITNNAIKKRDQEFKDWEAKLATEYSNLKPSSEVYDADRDVLANERRNAFSNIAKNSIYLAPSYQLKNPEKYNEVMANGQSYLEKVQMSKDDKTFEKSIIDMMKKDSSYDNIVNQKRLEKFRNSPLGERERFVPVADNSLDLMRQAKNIRELTKGDSFTDVQTDPASQTTTTTVKYDIPADQYVAVVSPINDAYNRAYFNDVATDEERALGYDVWNRNKILATKPPEYVDKASVRANEVYRQEQQNERAAMAVEGRKDVAEMNNTTKEEIAKYNVEVKSNPEFDKVSTALGQVDLLKESKEVSLPNAFISDINARLGSNFIKAQKVNSAVIPSDLLPKIYKGGKTEYGDAYGSLFYVEDANGNGKFVTGKPEYLVDGLVVSKDVYKESTAKNKRIDVVPDMKAGHIYTTDELAKQIATSTEKGKAQWNLYEAGKPKPKANQSPSNANLTFKHKNILGYVDEFKGMGIGIGAIDTGGHNQGTLHGKTLAVDIPQSKNGGVKQLELLLPKLKEKYPELDIVNEIHGPSRKGDVWSGPHIHIEMDSKKASFGGGSSQPSKSSTPSKKVWTGKFDATGKMIYK